MSGDKLTIHIDAAEKRTDLPDCGATDGKCPTCQNDLTLGFGLAGGGYGAYEYCEHCGKIVTKTEEQNE